MGQEKRTRAPRGSVAGTHERAPPCGHARLEECVSDLFPWHIDGRQRHECLLDVRGVCLLIPRSSRLGVGAAVQAHTLVVAPSAKHVIILAGGGWPAEGWTARVRESVTMAGNRERQGTAGPCWQVEVDADRCSLCEVCGQRCPTGAIRGELTDGSLSIVFNHRLCDGCRKCVESCPEKAMSLAETEALTDSPHERILATGGLLRCAVCGARFAPEAKLEAASHRRGDDAELISDQCPLCRRTQMVVTFIEEKRKTQGKKAEYRTGRKWRWKPVTEGDSDGPPCSEILPRPAERDPPAPCHPNSAPSVDVETPGNAHTNPGAVPTQGHDRD